MQERAVGSSKDKGDGYAKRAHGDQHHKSGDQVAGGNGLERVVVGADLERVERGEVPLHEHAAEPEEQETSEYVLPERAGRTAVIVQTF